MLREMVVVVEVVIWGRKVAVCWVEIRREAFSPDWEGIYVITDKFAVEILKSTVQVPPPSFRQCKATILSGR